MPDYRQGKIYALWDNNFTKCYIGKTVESLSNRKAKHKRKYKAYLNGTDAFTTSFSLFDEFGVDNCIIELLEHYPCSSKEELRAREGHHIRNEECINKRMEGRTKKQHYQDIREHQLKIRKEWRENNKEYKKDIDTKYRHENKEALNAKLKEKKLCSCGCYISTRNMASHCKTEKHVKLLNQ